MSGFSGGSNFVYCPQCGNLYPKSMGKCPKCGYVIERASHIKWIVVGIVAVLLLFIVLAVKSGGLSNNNFSLPTGNTTADNGAADAVKPENTAASDDYIEMSWETLIDEYEANQIAADEKYKGKNIKLTGSISDFERDFMSDDPWIIFEKSFMKRVVMVFDKSDEEQISTLSKGDSVTIVGKCDGESVSGYIYLKNCHLLQ